MGLRPQACRWRERHCSAWLAHRPVKRDALEDSLHGICHMSDCPSHRRLDQFCSGELGASDHAAVIAHLEVCAICEETLSSLLRGETVTLDPQISQTGNSSRANVIPPELTNHPRYRVLELLSVGGMGAVYKGEHLLLERYVVLKVIRRDLLNYSRHVRRFEREAKLAAQLSHPNSSSKAR